MSRTIAVFGGSFNPPGAHHRSVAQALAALGNNEEALTVLDAVESRRGDGLLVPAAELYAAAGEYGKANEIAENYRKQQAELE